MLPDSLVQQLQQHIKKVNWLHNKDLERGNGEVLLPKSFAKKYPNSSRVLKWQYHFPSKKIGKDPQPVFVTDIINHLNPLTGKSKKLPGKPVIFHRLLIHFIQTPF
jgi:hypothetical protein